MLDNNHFKKKVFDDKIYDEMYGPFGLREETKMSMSICSPHPHKCVSDNLMAVSRDLWTLSL